MWTLVQRVEGYRIRQVRRDLSDGRCTPQSDLRKLVTQLFRLSGRGRIDRAKPVTFSFNGKTVHGYAGDTVASALLANGIRLVGRSFKYHRPRGIFTHG